MRPTPPLLVSWFQELGFGCWKIILLGYHTSQVSKSKLFVGFCRWTPGSSKLTKIKYLSKNIDKTLHPRCNRVVANHQSQGWAIGFIPGKMLEWPVLEASMGWVEFSPMENHDGRSVFLYQVDAIKQKHVWKRRIHANWNKSKEQRSSFANGECCSLVAAKKILDVPMLHRKQIRHIWAIFFC